MTATTDWVTEIGEPAYAAIVKMVAALQSAGECESEEEARRRITEDPLSIRVFGERIDGRWEADRFEILLTDGGPSVKIVGELNDSAEPIHAWLEVRDWGKEWTEYYTPGIGDTLVTYASCFLFGE